MTALWWVNCLIYPVFCLVAVYVRDHNRMADDDHKVSPFLLPGLACAVGCSWFVAADQGADLGTRLIVCALLFVPGGCALFVAGLLASSGYGAFVLSAVDFLVTLGAARIAAGARLALAALTVAYAVVGHYHTRRVPGA